MGFSASILAWSALALVVALSPGPDTLLVASNGARRGHAAGLLTVAGTMTGGVFYAALCGFGFMSVLVAQPVLYAAVKIAGAAYLAVIGVQMLLGALKPPSPASRGLPPEGEDLPRKILPPWGRRRAQRDGGGQPFLQGLLTNVLNPKVAIFYMAALPQFVGQGHDAPMKGVLLIAIHYAMGGAWLSGVALAAGRAGQALRASAAMRWLEGVAGLFLIGVAGRLAVERR